MQAPGGCTFSAASTFTGIDPLLGALGDNGGLSLTAAPQTGSPLIDGGSCTLAADQRGLPRPADIPEAADAAGGNGCDIGALEVQLDMGAPGCTLEDLRARVVALGPEGDAVLNGGQTNALTRKVDQAARLRGKDKIDQAIHLLGAFRQQVSDLATEGVLSGSEAGALDECAAAAVEEVSGA